jgi:CO/xanthine dehydrogenase Mo-binding subunit
MTKGVSNMARSVLGDDHFQSEFHVKHFELTGKEVKDDSGFPVEDWASGGDLTTMILYNGFMNRLDGKFRLHLQWVDLDNVGHRVVLPDGVVKAIIRSHESVMRQSKSAGAKKAHQTRLDKGTVHETFMPRKAFKLNE